MDKYNYHDFLAICGIGGAHPGGLALTKELLKELKFDQNSRILDAGCGTGQTSAYLAKKYGCEITALDRHPIMLQKAKKRFSNENATIHVVCGDVEDIPLADESFDLILVESVTVFTNIRKTIAEFARLLRIGGALFDLEMTAATPFSEKMMRAFQEVYGIAHVPTENEWRKLFKQAGFPSIEVVHENTVANILDEQPVQTDTNELPDFDLSDSIDPSIYRIWDDHQQLTEKYADMMEYKVYRAMK
ncbi:SAM-dependent methyltransferase [Virgibacillus phasianinus]|uniref:SAM-dependent methyltransferase n=1 Tax=Virgibacillus phasianinus TaxID=2017483 RepID=A0A220TZM6_9BACI|nr:class I SAM-dependent methyltransferase [Virgibacillus phasianinus]ASK61232.1 SAM-dependent methyltransferase [Virgibacillus phasianinus]